MSVDQCLEIVRRLKKNGKFSFKHEDLDDMASAFLRGGTKLGGNSIKFSASIGLYAKSIQNLGTEKHHHFIDRAITFEDWGCFCLTELAHGSNVNGI